MAYPTMKVLIKEEEKVGYNYKEWPIPEPQDGELLVKVLVSSICGSDIALYNWNEVAKNIATLPFMPGHECVGEVVNVGPGCGDEFQVGNHVCCENHFYCGECYQCLHDQRHICQNLNQFGHGRGTIYGGCSQFTIIPARYAYRLKTNLEPRKACLLEPFGVAHQAMEALKPSKETVLVIGCGPVGLLAVGIAKAMGAEKIIATDINPDRLEKAKQMGADVLVNNLEENLKEIVLRETSGDGAGRLVECSGSPNMVNSSFSFLRKGGRIVLVGLPKAPLHVENVLSDVIFKSVTLKTVHGRKIFSTWEKSEQLIYQNKYGTSCC
ncbi:putative L-threonine 3-dehydrogenase [Exaiptasia diaphana]|nr:putative L-threonine 3-dehydrogenase [Exaiptasia diaphana]